MLFVYAKKCAGALLAPVQPHCAHACLRVLCCAVHICRQLNPCRCCNHIACSDSPPVASPASILMETDVHSLRLDHPLSWLNNQLPSARSVEQRLLMRHLTEDFCWLGVWGKQYWFCNILPSLRAPSLVSMRESVSVTGKGWLTSAGSWPEIRAPPEGQTSMAHSSRYDNWWFCELLQLLLYQSGFKVTAKIRFWCTSQWLSGERGTARGWRLPLVGRPLHGLPGVFDSVACFSLQTSVLEFWFIWILMKWTMDC